MSHAVSFGRLPDMDGMRVRQTVVQLWLWEALARSGSLAMVQCLLAALLISVPAAADSDQTARPWSDGYPSVRRDLVAGQPLVVEVFVPLCSNDQIWCGSKWAGQPGSLQANIYWGAIFGARTHFRRPSSGWAPLGVTPGDAVFLEQAVFRRQVSAARWGLRRDRPVEQLVVLRAVHGAHIDRAVREFYARAARGGVVTIDDSGTTRTLRVHAVGYAGHNRLMDGIAFPPPLPATKTGDGPIASFVLACISEKYFSGALRSVGSEPIVMTDSFMAPEGYVVDAVTQALGDNESARGARARAVAAYASWQRLSPQQVSPIFAPR